MTDTAASAPVELTPIAYAKNYAEFVEIIRNRIEAFNISRAELDFAAELQEGYTSKLLGRSASRNFGKKSLGNMLRTLGLVLIVAEDPRATEQIRRTFTQKKRRDPINQYLSEIGRRGGQRTAQKAAAATP